jgi:sodium transport system ATP-binding protein
MIAAVDLKKYFGPVAAVNGVTFTANDGQVTGLLGPNGAGKTTTLRMLGVMRPDAGDHDRSRRCRQAPARCPGTLGVLPDIAGLYPRLTAANRCATTASCTGLKARRSRNAPELLKTLDLMHLANRRRPATRTASAPRWRLRALVHEPQNMILESRPTASTS